MRPTRIASRPDLPPWEIEWHIELGSTMERGRELVLAGAPAGTVVVADFQRQGRGTHGRVWVAPSGTCLMFTFILRGQFDGEMLASLPGRVARLACDVLRREYALPVEVKPPNDLLVAGRKLAGVLCLSQMAGERSTWALCGIGLNTALSSEELAVENATSLRMLGVAEICHARLLEQLLSGFDALREA